MFLWNCLGVFFAMMLKETDFSRERAKDFGGKFELGKQATTVMSTTAGFESRPRYGKKKEEEEDGKRN